MRRSISPVNTANTPSILTSAGTAVAAGEKRGWMIQNLGTNPLFINMGGTASTTVFHAVIKGGTANDDGLGGSYSQTQGAVFQQAVTVAGTTPRFTVTILY